VLDDARAFFDLPHAIKSELAIEHSQHFRGYSEMQNERDWREQLHLGAEREPLGNEPQFLQLEGPNLWPPDPAWRDRILRYLSDVANIGKEILANICAGLGSERNSFTDKPGLDPYLVMKLICYHPQPEIDGRRPDEQVQRFARDQQPEGPADRREQQLLENDGSNKACAAGAEGASHCGVPHAIASHDSSDAMGHLWIREKA